MNEMEMPSVRSRPPAPDNGSWEDAIRSAVELRPLTTSVLGSPLRAGRRNTSVCGARTLWLSDLRTVPRLPRPRLATNLSDGIGGNHHGGPFYESIVIPG